MLKMYEYFTHIIFFFVINNNFVLLNNTHVR